MTLHSLILRAPLVPVAIIATVGIVVDRFGKVEWEFWSAAVLIGFIIWMIVGRRNIAAVIGLALTITGLAAVHHNLHRSVFRSNDIGNLVHDDPRLYRLRGRVVGSPTFETPAKDDPLRSIPEAARTHCILEVETLVNETFEQSVSGLVALTIRGDKPGLSANDAVEVTGWAEKPRGPDNPGQRNYASELLDRRIRATMFVRGIEESAIDHRTSELSWARLLANIRDWSRRQLDESLPPNEANLAAALFLGDGAAITRADWDKYIRTGVIHVLAVSGQHLAILAGFLWFVLRAVGTRRRTGALLVAIALCSYAALAGGRPPVLRAAVMVAVASGATVLRRVSNPANEFALAWLAVVVVNPSDVVDAGCQFSFMCVAILIWGIRRWWKQRPHDPLQKLIEAARPTWQRWLFSLWRVVVASYTITLVLGLAVMPLVASRYHLISPVGLLIGPPAIAIASVALISGFLQLSAALICPPVVSVFAFVTRWSLTALIELVDAADRLPLGHSYVGNIPAWWVIGFYLILGTAIVVLWQRRLLGMIAIVGWFILGIVATFIPPPREGLRITFMAVGHGGATLIETPDGRNILVDAGAMSGPNVTRRILAPCLWEFGVHRLDEVFITHADLDHFNGLPSLMERFAIGRVSLTPTFAAKATPGVHEIKHRLLHDDVPTRIVVAGDQFVAGNVEFSILHPPVEGPAGPENARSLVMLIRHAGHCIALTGDLDLEGRMQVMAQPRPMIDVWMAPHHGGRVANPPELAEWVGAKLVVAHNGAGEGDVAGANYMKAGAEFLDTARHGAITIVSCEDGLWIETFRNSRKRLIASR